MRETPTIIPYTTLFRSDLQHLGYGTAESCHLIAEALKIAFADRAAATADPDFVAVPVERLLSKDYAAARRRSVRHRLRSRSEEHTSELQSQSNLVCRLL